MCVRWASSLTLLRKIMKMIRLMGVMSLIPSRNVKQRITNNLWKSKLIETMMKMKLTPKINKHSTPWSKLSRICLDAHLMRRLMKVLLDLMN